MKKKIVIIGGVGLLVGLFVFDYFILNPLGGGTIPLVTSGSIILMAYGFLAKYKEKIETYATPPPQPHSSNVPTCQNCGGSLEFIQQYKRWYCRKCQKYA